MHIERSYNICDACGDHADGNVKGLHHNKTWLISLCATCMHEAARIMANAVRIVAPIAFVDQR